MLREKEKEREHISIIKKVPWTDPKAKFTIIHTHSKG